MPQSPLRTKAKTFATTATVSLLTTITVFGCETRKAEGTYDIISAKGSNIVAARHWPTNKIKHLRLLGTRPLRSTTTEVDWCRRNQAQKWLAVTAENKWMKTFTDSAAISQGVNDFYLEYDSEDIGLTMIQDGYLEADTNYDYGRRRSYEHATFVARRGMKGLWGLGTCFPRSDVSFRDATLGANNRSWSFK
jgi:endonuclease YncB( thermonuclease family)